MCAADMGLCAVAGGLAVVLPGMVQYGGIVANGIRLKVQGRATDKGKGNFPHEVAPMSNGKVLDPFYVIRVPNYYGAGLTVSAAKRQCRIAGGSVKGKRIVCRVEGATRWNVDMYGTLNAWPDTCTITEVESVK